MIISALGITVGLYILTRMLELERKKDPKPSLLTRVFAFLTFAFAFVSIITVAAASLNGKSLPTSLLDVKEGHKPQFGVYVDNVKNFCKDIVKQENNKVGNCSKSAKDYIIDKYKTCIFLLKTFIADIKKEYFRFA
jgi:hypothetical protein